MVEAFAQRDRDPSSAPPPKPGMSGCAIAAIAGAVLAVIGLFLMGILAAIAIPAYQQYLARARVFEAYYAVESTQTRIDELYAQHGVCPGNVDVGYGEDAILELGGAEGRADDSHAELTIGTLGNGRCAIELRFRNIAATVDDKTLVLESNDGAWTCSGGTLGREERPAQCRTSDDNASTENEPENEP
jgi:type IV pilus assembly protein PilA